MKKKNDASASEQIERFRVAARELGCDPSEERFNEALKKVARHKQPKPDSELMKPGGKPAVRSK